MIREAKKLGDNLCVIVANDKQAENKRKPVFMNIHDRMAIIGALKDVDFVVESIDEDTNVCKTLEMIKPDIFASGCSHSHPDAIAEKVVCEKLNIHTCYNVGGNKINSSSVILNNYVSSI